MPRMVTKHVKTMAKANPCVCACAALPRTLCALIYLIIKTAFGHVYYYHLYFVDKDTKAEKALVTCPKPQS